MDDETHRKKSSAALKISLVVLGVLVLLGVIQAVTSGTVGVGALSVTLRETSSAAPTTQTSTSDDTIGGLDGAVGSAPSTSEEQEAPPSAQDKVVAGSWKQARGLLTVEVTKVENRGGRLKVFVTAINASTAKMDLPVPSISAVDDAQRDYAASVSTSRWPASIAKNSSITGFVELDQKVSAAGTTFSLTFSGIIGQLAPTGGAVTVSGIPIPK
jgi:flagellar basal body-associated protein FliL